MTTERFNGIKINTDRISNEELYNLIDTTQERRNKADEELQRLVGIAAMRGLVEGEG